jgi:hypothetical protein
MREYSLPYIVSFLNVSLADLKSLIILGIFMLVLFIATILQPPMAIGIKSVFISYSHDSPECSERVFSFGWALEGNGCADRLPGS